MIEPAKFDFASVFIRRATPEEAEAIYLIYQHRNDDRDRKCSHTVEDFSDYIANKDRCMLMVAEAMGRPAGFVLVFDHVTWGMLDAVCTAYKYRGLGVGKTLMEYVLKNPRDNWRSIEVCLDAHDDDLQRFFNRLGWTNDLPVEPVTRRFVPLPKWHEFRQ